ncbi:hypothetical protein [Methylobacterium sp. 37f]|uniref:hypothetical protein n=1 Tax=Methylobacterium sp. 37f TaxID=2817058 RepID=UPI001FFCEABD|nr:hypothetical protein [Methylobacterium sp. 37f]MCK2055277.1 hypothetical protein [Methylobacterium sp. 37f]
MMTARVSVLLQQAMMEILSTHRFFAKSLLLSAVSTGPLLDDDCAGSVGLSR